MGAIVVELESYRKIALKLLLVTVFGGVVSEPEQTQARVKYMKNVNNNGCQDELSTLSRFYISFYVMNFTFIIYYNENELS